jgi:hypothetical protein
VIGSIRHNESLRTAAGQAEHSASARLLSFAWRRSAGAPALNGGEQVTAPEGGPISSLRGRALPPSGVGALLE